MRYLDNWSESLAAPLAVDALAVALARGGELVEGQLYALTLSNSLLVEEQSAWEIVHAQRSGEVVAISRGQGGTAPAPWPADSVIYCSVTAAALNSQAASVDSLTASVDSLTAQLAALTLRVEALEAGGGTLPENALTDESGNALVDDQGNTLTAGA